MIGQDERDRGVGQGAHRDRHCPRQKLGPVLELANELAVLVHFAVVRLLRNVEEVAHGVLVPVAEQIGKPEAAHELDRPAQISRQGIDRHAHVGTAQRRHGPDLARDEIVLVQLEPVEHRVDVPESLGHDVGADGRVGQEDLEVANDARLGKRAVDDAKVVCPLARNDRKGQALDMGLDDGKHPLVELSHVIALVREPAWLVHDNEVVRGRGRRRERAKVARRVSVDSWTHCLLLVAGILVAALFALFALFAGILVAALVAGQFLVAFDHGRQIDHVGRGRFGRHVHHGAPQGGK
jgi:hypothetical protein